MAKTYNVTKVLAYAAAQVGKPYRWAGSGPGSFDCSGLTMRAFAAGGYRMPHNSMAQYLQTARFKIPPSSSPPAGCLLFFGSFGVMTHCGISIGGGEGIFAPHTGTVVQRESIAAVRAGFGNYQVTNPLGVSETTDLTVGEEVYASLGSGGNPIPPGLGLFLAALRWQESGSQHGNYREPNGQGAYQIIPSTWKSLATRYNVGNYPTASSAPPLVQDEVAARRVTEIYYGVGEKSWRVTARVWNGGTPNSVPNPALGPGATTNTYATELLAKMAKINPAQLTSAASKSAAQQAAADAAANPNTGCAHKVSIDLKITSANLCMDKPIAIIAFSGGLLLIFGGVAIGFAATFGKSKTLNAAAAAIPGGKALTVAKAAMPAARQARDEKRAGEQARRLAPLTAEQRRNTAAAAAEQRQAAAAAQRAELNQARHEAAEKRRNTAARSANRRRNLDARARRRQTVRVYPGPFEDDEPRRRPARRAPLPDKAPF